MKKLFKLFTEFSVWENNGKRRNTYFELVVDAKRAAKVRSSPNFVDRKIYNESMVWYLKNIRL